MTLHLIKLCVGAESIDDLAQWQKKRLAERKKRGQTLQITHTTRQTPKRADDLLDGGSLYWVIKGQIAVRQRVLALKPAVKNGVPHCAIVLDAKLVPTLLRPRRAFQGWRYLESVDAPRDLKKGEVTSLPEKLRVELTTLGLI